MKNKELFRGPQLKVRVLRRHFDLATNNGKIPLHQAYYDFGNCPIAQAVKELFPNCDVSVGGITIDINNISYILVDNDGNDQETQILKNKPCTVIIQKMLV